MTTDEHGRLAWIGPCGTDPDRAERIPGERPDGTFPESFLHHVGRCGILDATNRQFDTMLDRFEEDDIASQACLAFLAGQLDAFRSHELEQLVRQDLVPFLLSAARRNQCLTFNLSG